MKLLIAFPLSVCLAQAHAQRPGVVAGAGSVSCGDYLEHRKKDWHGEVYAHWVMGFISAYNLYGNHPPIPRIPEASTIHAYLEKYCREEPLNILAGGAGALLADLGGYRPPYIQKKK